LGNPFHARRGMRWRPDRQHNTSCNKDQGRCDRDPVAIDFESTTAAMFGHRQSACLPAGEFSGLKRLIL
jgi:hypothetical protein